MAERTVTVRLRALVDDYKKAMRSAGDATVSAAAKADAFSKLGRSTANLGDTLTRNITLPIAAAGVVAVKLATDFDSVFARMTATAGVSASEVDGLKESVLGLAGETGRAPQELAEALMFIRSSGLSGQTALDALEMSAKAAAAGLGSTAEVADAVTNAINGYGPAAITAAEATDVLVASVEQGKAEASEMAPQFGRLIPIAAELGVSFDQVGGTLAYLTKASGDASQSSTALQGILSKLLRPSRQGAEALAEIGISATDLRNMLADQGLHGTLMTLREQLSDSGFQMVFDDIQAVNGALQLTGPGAQDAAAVINAVGASAGKTESAFQKMAESAGFKNVQAFAKLQAAMIQFGEAVIPVVADLASWIAAVAEVFGKLPGPAKQALLVFAGLLAVAGPLMSVGGRLVSVVSTVSKAFAGGVGGGRAFAEAMNMSGQAAGRAAPMLAGLGIAGGVATAVIGVGLAIDAADKAADKVRFNRLAEEFLATGDAATLLTEAVNGNLDDLENFTGTFGTLLETNVEGADRFLDSAEAAGLQGDMLDRARAAVEQKREADVQASVDQEANTAAVEAGTDAYGEQAGTVEEAVQALQDYADEIASMSDPLFGLNSALTQNRDAQSAVADAERELTTARDGGNALEVMAAEQKLTDARISAGETAFGVAQAEATLAAAIAENPALLGQVNDMLDGFVASGTIAEADALVLAERFGVLGERVEGVPEEAGVTVSETGADPTRRALDFVTEAAFGVPPRRNTNTSTSGTGGARSALDRVMGAAFGIPGRRNTSTTTSGTGSARSALDGVAKTAHSIPKNVTVTVTTKRIGEVLPKRARGGPVIAGESYIVGERGPEVLTLGGRSGTVYPNSVFDRTSGGASLPVAPMVRAMDPMTLVKAVGAVGLAVRESVTRQIAADSVHHHHLIGWLDRHARSELDHMANGIETLIRMQQLGPRNVRWFEDLASVPMASGGIVRRRPGGVLATLGEGPFDEAVIPLDGRHGGGTTVLNFDLRGSHIANEAAFVQRVSDAVNRGLASGTINNRGKVLR